MEISIEYIKFYSISTNVLSQFKGIFGLDFTQPILSRSHDGKSTGFLDDVLSGTMPTPSSMQYEYYGTVLFATVQK